MKSERFLSIDSYSINSYTISIDSYTTIYLTLKVHKESKIYLYESIGLVQIL